MIKLEFKLSTLLIGAFISGFFIGMMIVGSILNDHYRTSRSDMNQKNHELKIKNTELQGKVESDLRLLQEIRRKQK